MKKNIIALCAMMASVLTLSAQSLAFTVGNINILPGGETNIVINYQFDKPDVYKGYELHLFLPEGIDVTYDSNSRIVYTPGDCYDGHTITANYKTKNLKEDEEPHVVFACLSLNAYPLLGTSGTLLTIPVKASKELAMGRQLTAEIKGIVVQDQKLPDVEFTVSTSAAVPGDVNGDGSITIVDVTQTISHVLGQTPTGFNASAADVDGNNTVDVVDVTTIIDMVLGTAK